MSNTNHTPTPWIARGSRIGTTDGRGIADITPYVLPQNQREANAAHIVKCVNAHDELIDVIRGLLDAGDPAGEDYLYAVKAARAALAKVQS